MDNGLTTLQFFIRCALFAFLWLGIILGIVYSLTNLDATAVMALFSFSSSLTYFLSWVILHQQFVGIRVSSEGPQKRSNNISLHFLTFKFPSRLWL